MFRIKSFTKIFSVILIVFIVLSVQAQDCDNAIILTDSVHQAPAPKHGGRQELGFNSMKDLYYFQKEHHTVWYKFTAQQDCELTFEIIPQSIEDDYDFLLFKTNTENACQLISEKKLKPIRTNISRNNTRIKSRTGLQKNALANFVHSGVGADYSRSVETQKGDTFILIVDNVYINGKGHTLKIFDCLSQEIPPTSIRNEYVEKSDSISENKLENHLRTSTDTIIEEVSMFDTLEIGETIILDNVYFHGNSSFAKMESVKQLTDLWRFMTRDSTMRIRIHAHTNGDGAPDRYSRPKDENTDIFAPNRYTAFNARFCKYFRGNARKLSQARAESVRNFLIKKGINSDRLELKGWGARNMLFPEESPNAHLNRRVEIEVLLK